MDEEQNFWVNTVQKGKKKMKKAREIYETLLSKETFPWKESQGGEEKNKSMENMFL